MRLDWIGIDWHTLAAFLAATYGCAFARVTHAEEPARDAFQDTQTQDKPDIGRGAPATPRAEVRRHVPTDFPELGGNAVTDEVWVHPAAKPLHTTITGATVVLGDGRLLKIHDGEVYTSSDDARSWDKRPLGHASEKVTGAEDFLIRSSSGALVLVYRDLSEQQWEWDNETHDLTSDPRLPVYSMRSEDDGQTWSQPVRLPTNYCGGIISAIQTRSGRLVVPVMVMLRDPGRHGQTTCVSDDDGLTWKQSNIIDLGGHGHHDGACEGSVVELRNGRLWMVLRTNLDRMWQAFSEDEGRSWRTILPTDIDASSSPAFVKRLSSGRLMMAWNRLYPEGLTAQQKTDWKRAGGDRNICEPLSSWHRRELSVAFSDDDGEHWTPPTVLMSGKQCSYPMILEREPGVIWVGTRFGPRVGAWFREQDLLDHEKQAGT